MVPFASASEIHATVSTTQDAPRASTRHEKEMSGTDGWAENQTNQQVLQRVVKNNKNEKTVTS